MNLEQLDCKKGGIRCQDNKTASYTIIYTKSATKLLHILAILILVAVNAIIKVRLGIVLKTLVRIVP